MRLISQDTRGESRKDVGRAEEWGGCRTVSVVMVCMVMVILFKLSSTRDRMEVVVTMLVGVADVKLRQLHAVEMTSHAKYMTAAGAVEHEGRGSGEDMGVGEGVMAGELDSMGVEDGMIAIEEMDGTDGMRMLDASRDGRTRLRDEAMLIDGTKMLLKLTMLSCGDSAVEELACSEVEEG